MIDLVVDMAIYTYIRYIVLDLEMKKRNILIRNEKSKKKK